MNPFILFGLNVEAAHILVQTLRRSRMLQLFNVFLLQLGDCTGAAFYRLKPLKLFMMRTLETVFALLQRLT